MSARTSSAALSSEVFSSLEQTFFETAQAKTDAADPVFIDPPQAHGRGSRRVLTTMTGVAGLCAVFVTIGLTTGGWSWRVRDKGPVASPPALASITFGPPVMASPRPSHHAASHAVAKKATPVRIQMRPHGKLAMAGRAHLARLHTRHHAHRARG